LQHCAIKLRATAAAAQDMILVLAHLQVGHTLGLSHDGHDDGAGNREEYYTGKFRQCLLSKSFRLWIASSTDYHNVIVH
jgi:hypothetical protein